MSVGKSISIFARPSVLMVVGETHTIITGGGGIMTCMCGDSANSDPDAVKLCTGRDKTSAASKDDNSAAIERDLQYVDGNRELLITYYQRGGGLLVLSAIADRLLKESIKASQVGEQFTQRILQVKLQRMFGAILVVLPDLSEAVQDAAAILRGWYASSTSRRKEPGQISIGQMKEVRGAKIKMLRSLDIQGKEPSGADLEKLLNARFAYFGDTDGTGGLTLLPNLRENTSHHSCRISRWLFSTLVERNPQSGSKTPSAVHPLDLSPPILASSNGSTGRFHMPPPTVESSIGCRGREVQRVAVGSVQPYFGECEF